ncbi:MAG TPA: hypothetical protein VHY35_07105 [Stellaceae bacterium]|jgi:hypothetical protein|nr:hypothetical protein [Stellaceae bacterium]
MPDPSEYRFVIDVFTPDTIPMARLAEYMAQVAVLLGEPKSVHFVCVEAGSAALVSKVDADAVPKVRDRVTRQRRGEGDKTTNGAVFNLNEMLRVDNGKAKLSENSAEIIVFPGREIEPPTRYPSFSQDGTLDGIVIRLGGRNDPVPVWIQSGDAALKCSASRNVAKRLAQHIFEREVRLRGVGRWQINEYGTWLLDGFTIADFSELDDEPLTSLVDNLRKIAGSEWETVADPWSELMEMRNGPAERH